MDCCSLALLRLSSHYLHQHYGTLLSDSLLNPFVSNNNNNNNKYMDTLHKGDDDDDDDDDNNNNVYG
jgi:hypothetical protein